MEIGYTTRYKKYIYQRSRREAISQIAEDEGLSEEAVQAINVRPSRLIC